MRNHQKTFCFTMFLEGRGRQTRAKIYQIPNRKPSKKHCQFQGRFLLDFDVILGPIWAPFCQARSRFAEKPASRNLVIFVGHPWGVKISFWHDFDLILLVCGSMLGRN